MAETLPGAIEVRPEAVIVPSPVTVGIIGIVGTASEGDVNKVELHDSYMIAKAGVRAVAEPYVGMLDDDRVRKALKGSINGFLAEMVSDEMLISYELDVAGMGDEGIRGICRVTMTLRPTFSIDFIKVVMFLE